ncbi:hypothetical protein LTR95_001280 [Oleoguttula sp. CCFEE 5521]
MSDTPAWTWSESLNAHWMYDEDRNVIVTSDGRHLAPTALSQPRTSPTPSVSIPASGSTARRTESTQDVGSSSSSSRPGTSPKYTTRDAASLITAMNDMRLAPGNTRSTDPTIYQGVDRASRIRSAIKFEPKNEITEPALYKTGVRAHAKLLAIDSNDDREFLDPAYGVRKQPNRLFVPGKIFMVLWAEPAGASSLVTTLHTGGIIPGRHREQIFSKVRRFVVIRSGDRSCSALSILTYDHQGAKKQYLDASENGIVYTGKSVPAGASRDRGLLKEAIRINPDDPSDKLDAESLIHYGKVYTIEHNIKVKPLGMVHDDSLEPLLRQFREVWVCRVGLPRAAQTPAPVPRSAYPQSGSASTPGVPRRAGEAAVTFEPLSLTARQRAAIEQHGAVVDGLRRNPSDADRRSSRDNRQSTRGSGAGSDTAQSSTDASRQASARYRQLRDALLARGYGADDAARRALQEVRRRAADDVAEEPQQEDGASSESEEDSGDECDSEPEQSTSRAPVQPSPAQIALDALIAGGRSREEALRVLQQLRNRQGPSTGKGKERQR